MVVRIWDAVVAVRIQHFHVLADISSSQGGRLLERIGLLEFPYERPKVKDQNYGEDEKYD